MVGMFDSYGSWWRYTRKAIRDFCRGLANMFCSLTVGVLSLFRALWRLVSRQVGNYPSFALGFFLMALVFVWFITFTSMRARAVGMEAQRDSVAWQFLEFKQQHGYE